MLSANDLLQLDRFLEISGAVASSKIDLVTKLCRTSQWNEKEVLEPWQTMYKSMRGLTLKADLEPLEMMKIGKSSSPGASAETSASSRVKRRRELSSTRNPRRPRRCL